MTEWITSLTESLGALGVALLMFVENVFPPIPSELVMPLGGYVATQGGGGSEGALVVMILAGTVGAVAGALLWYWVGYRIGIDGLKTFSQRHGRWLTLTPEEIDKADRWFDRHGGKAVLIGRLIPTVRTFISVPAGASGMPLGVFLIYTTAGTMLWTTILALAGWWLGTQYDQVSRWLGPASTVVLAGLLIWYLYRVITFSR